METSSNISHYTLNAVRRNITLTKERGHLESTMSPAGGALSIFLLVQLVTVMSQDMSSPDMNMTFTPLPQDFRETAKKLMMKCFKNGYSPPDMESYFMNSTTAEPEKKMGNPFLLFPGLLSSLPPLFVNYATMRPDMDSPFQQNPDMNITEKMQNCTGLPQLVKLIKNTTEEAQCFMRAFVAPLSWAAVLHNSSQLSPEELRMMMWAAKPFLEALPPSPLILPSKLQNSSHLEEMMKLFSEVFDSLSEEHRNEIWLWMKQRIIESDPLCPPNQGFFSILTSKPPKPTAKPEPLTNNHGLQTGQMNGVTSGDTFPDMAHQGLAVNKISTKSTNILVHQQPSSKLEVIPENQQNVSKPTGFLLNQQNPSKLVDTPINLQNPNKSVETPVNQQNPNKLVDTPINLQNPNKSVETPVNQQNPNKLVDTPINLQNPNKSVETPVNQQNPNKLVDTPINLQNPNKSVETPVNQQNPNKLVDTPINLQNPNKDVGTPVNQQNPNKLVDTPINLQNPNKSVETPVNQQNPNKLVDTPINLQNPNKSVEDSVNQQNSNKLIDTPINQQNPNKPVETPVNQQNPNKDVGTSVNQQNPNKPAETQKQQDSSKPVEIAAHQPDSSGTNNDPLTQIEVWDGNNKNESTVQVDTGNKETGSEKKETEKDGKSNTAGCLRTPWLKAVSLKIMGRFFSRLPVGEMKAIPSEELCMFFNSPEFPSSFISADGMQPAIGQMLVQRFRECPGSSQTFQTQMDRLGSLICFCEDIPDSLNVPQSMKLLSYLGKCENKKLDQIKRNLMNKLLEVGALGGLELLQVVGCSVSVLSPNKLSRLNAEDLKTGLSCLSSASLNAAQARVLACKFLKNDKNITSEKLLALGSVVRGVESDILRNVKAQGLLGNVGLKTITENMSPLQKKALLEGMRSSVNDSYLVSELPDSLLTSVSVPTLEKAGFTSLKQVEGRNWTLIQSVYLLKKILKNQMITPEKMRKLGQAVLGITCSMVESFSQSETLASVQALANSSHELSRIQIRCAAQKLFLSLEKERSGYFVNISDSELQAIPALLLIHLPIKAIQGLPDTVCARFLEKMSQTNLSSLPNSAPSRWELRDRALRCLGKNASALSTADIWTLGPLVCELNPTWTSSLNPAVLNYTLQTITACRHIPRPYRAPLYTLVQSVYGDPSVWSEDVMKSLGPLLLLNRTALEALPNKAWLKSYLSDLLESLQAQSPVLAPEEFRIWHDLSILRQKLFYLKTQPTQLRRRRSIASAIQLSQSVIEDLREGNMYWSPTQLSNMSAQTFRDSFNVLGEIRNYTAEQLAALREKAREAWGDLSALNQTQIVELGCICQGFNTTELQNLNITSLDTLELLSVCKWNQTQKNAVWQGFVTRTGTKMSKFKALEMVGLGQFICGMQPGQIDQLNTTEFKEATENIGSAKCPVPILECLKNKAVSAFGAPKSWGEAEVSMMGNMIAGLNGTELASLNSSVLPFIRLAAIPLIPPVCLAAMAVSQLRSLGPDNAAMLTESQQSVLTVEQRAAVNESLGLPVSRTEITTSSPVAVPQKGGAPTQSVYGILLLPAALLLLGFIL